MSDEAEHQKRRVDALAELAAVCDARNRKNLEELLTALSAVIEARGALPPDHLNPVLQQTLESLTTHLASDSVDGGAVLKSVAAAVVLLQEPPAGTATESGGIVERDADTVDLISGFLEEGADGLSRADSILMAGEKTKIGSSEIAELFRVFHTIKGVAGFIDLPQICSVAHITETLLDLAREGQLMLAGRALDLVFESTSLMRKLMHEVRSALEAGTAVEALAEVAPHVARFKEEIARAGTGAQEKEAPAAIPVATAGPVQTQAKVVEAPPAFKTIEPAAALPPAKSTTPEHAPRAAVADAEAPHGGERIRETLKVDVLRVDSVVEMIGELIIVESMVVNAPELVAVESLKLRNYLNQLTKISRDLQDVAMRMRMVPVRGIFQKMARLTRDLAHKTGKKIVMQLAGEDTEMDRSMAERLEEPLVHMVRNAVDHGVELGDARRTQGKSEQATLRLSATHEGGNIVIELADDGKGLDTKALLAKARSKGLVDPNEHLTDSEIHALIFAPGFSTAAVVTELSGRGVGMDVVKRNVEAMRGRIVVESTWGEGTSMRMVLPLTLAIIDGMLVSCGPERFIVPSLSIVESLRPTTGMLFSVGEREEFVNVRGELLPLFRLGQAFNIAQAITDPTEALGVVVESNGQKIVLLADDVLAQQQVVIKALGAGLGNAENFSGAAILSDGKAGLILNVDRLISTKNTSRSRKAPVLEARL